ncbi:MAG: GNAT family N-acetyltransferase [Chloroflexi bacterium]|nr:GNAT family N-acetyltransferase [Chloroflexota bacterium]
MSTVAIRRAEAGPVAATTRDRAVLREFLERDRLFAAYAICDLDEREFPRTRWALSRQADEVVALGVSYEGSSPQPLLVMGSDAGIQSILRDVLRPRLAYIAALPSSLPAVGRRYHLDPGPAMVRMAVTADRFRPVEDPGVERLSPLDTPELNRLYRLGFGSWLPSQAVVEGVYYGLRIRNRLVAAAGTHIVSRDARLAVVGNVMTAAEFRGHGYAKAVTAAVTAELLGFCDDVVLNVRADNPPALNAYRRIGYVEHVRYEERLARRTGSLLGEIGAALRRRLLPGD